MCARGPSLPNSLKCHVPNFKDHLEEEWPGGSVVAPHHVDADPDPDFYLIRMRIRVSIMMRIHADPNPDADPDPQHWSCWS